MESEWAGTPARMIRERYRTAADRAKVRGKCVTCVSWAVTQWEYTAPFVRLSVTPLPADDTLCMPHWCKCLGGTCGLQAVLSPHKRH